MSEDKKILYVEGREVEFTNERNLLEVIRKAGIEVPTFCYRPDLTEYGACRMCVVEIEGRGIQSSCTTPPEQGIKVHVNTERTRRVRKIALELLLANHNRECTLCEKSNNCELQKLAKQFGIKDIRFEQKRTLVPVDASNPSIVRDPNKCILCGACVRACKEIQGHGILDIAFRGSNSVVTPSYGMDMADADCVYCGQCAAVCPTGALSIKSDVEIVWDEIVKPNKTVVVQIAPAVRVAVGEAFGLKPGENTIGKISAALRKIGFDKVFDTSFTADLTIMEEGTEFISRFKKGEKLPIFTSCCPAWVRYAELKYPELSDKLSTCKSPQQMFGSMAKELVSKEENKSRNDIVVVSIMPCTAKKAECKRSEFYVEGNPDVDYVLTTQELIKMIEEAGINFNNIQEEELDAPYGMYSGAGLIFAASGGVAEAALRTAYEVVEGKPLANIDIKEARGAQTLKELSVTLAGKEVKVAIVNTLGEADKIVQKVLKGEVQYDIVEIMACPGGCVGGAGQPISCNSRTTKKDRAAGIYAGDCKLPIRKSHENKEVQELYKQWLQQPNSELAHKYLHTHYKNRKETSYKNVEVAHC
ncbi:MAG: NADH-dependent [FeFe] hydrogenase, group A6 [Candidatus Gastranaerophilaceae bacterium]|jgi:NADH-quinone oxidoreductase subunit G